MSNAVGPEQAEILDAAPPRVGDATAMQLLRQVQVGMFVDQDDVLVYANPALADLLGWSDGELIGVKANDLVTEEFREAASAVARRRLAGKVGRPGDMRFLRRDGSSFDARVHARRIDYEGRPAVLVTVTDIGELKQALQRAEWNAGMLARTESLCRLGSFEVILPGGEVTVSAGLRALVGLPNEDDAPVRIDTLPWVPEDERALVAGIWQTAVHGEPLEFQHRVVCSDGRRLTVRGPAGQVQRVKAVIDTGFDGWLSAPPALIAVLGLPWRRRGLALLADGRDSIFDIYEATVVWDRRRRRVPVDAADTIPLVGMALMDGFELNAQIRVGGKVTIQPLP